MQNTNHTSRIIDALVLETATDLINSTTGNEQALTKLVTTEGRLVNIWHSDNKCPAKANEEVKLVIEPSTKTDANGNPYINYAIIPASFAARIQPAS